MISVSKRVAARGTVLVNIWEREQGIGSKSLQNAACSKKKDWETHIYKQSPGWKMIFNHRITSVLCLAGVPCFIPEQSQDLKQVITQWSFGFRTI